MRNNSFYLWEFLKGKNLIVLLLKMDIGIVVSTCVGSLGHNFLLVHDVTFGDGILNVLHRRRLKEEKVNIVMYVVSTAWTI